MSFYFYFFTFNKKTLLSCLFIWGTNLSNNFQAIQYHFSFKKLQELASSIIFYMISYVVNKIAHLLHRSAFGGRACLLGTHFYVTFCLSVKGTSMFCFLCKRLSRSIFKALFSSLISLLCIFQCRLCSVHLFLHFI